MTGMPKVTADTLVYVASGWWEDNDPYVYVVGLDPARVEREVMRAHREMARAARDDGSYRTITDAMDHLFWSGVHPERLGDYASQRELEDAVRDLSKHKIWFPG